MLLSLANTSCAAFRHLGRERDFLAGLETGGTLHKNTRRRDQQQASRDWNIICLAQENMNRPVNRLPVGTCRPRKSQARNRLIFLSQAADEIVNPPEEKRGDGLHGNVAEGEVGSHEQPHGESVKEVAGLPAD